MRLYDSAHLGRNIIYLDSADKPYKMSSGLTGGSIVCKKNRFFKVGKFNEKFYGHGYEDIEFYRRLEDGSFFDSGLINFVHLHHTNSNKYMARSKINKMLCEKLKVSG